MRRAGNIRFRSRDSPKYISRQFYEGCRLGAVGTRQNGPVNILARADFLPDPATRSGPVFAHAQALAQTLRLADRRRRDFSGRPAIEPALSQIDAEIQQALMLVVLLDHLRHRLDAEALAGGEHAL